MLRSLKDLTDYVLEAEDGEIGRCKDFLFDDRDWTVRYMVADTGKWLPGRKVLISPISLGAPDWESKRFPVRLSMEQIENGPSLDEDAPVSRKYETSWFDYYGWPYYWTGDNLWGFFPEPSALYTTPLEGPEPMEPEPSSEETHLRSAEEVNGYHIEARDGEIGHVEDFIVDQDVWVIRYIVIDTRNWLPGHKVLALPPWIESVEWVDREVHMDVDRETVEKGPEYDPKAPINREYEIRVYDYYGRPRYWE
jgi:hypothetical protein